jgi:uncharacterized protein (TIGR02453 family)
MSFTGFSTDLDGFLADLTANNSKDWFDANRDRYETAFLEPARAFVEAIADDLDSLMPGLTAEPRVNGSIRRINRDTRFSKDKRPYHDHMHLIFWRGEKANSSPGYHLVLRAGGGGIGAGQWAMTDTELAAYRAAVMTREGASSLREVIAKAESMPGQELDSPALKRVPRGFDGAPDPDLLRHKGIVVRGDMLDVEELYGPQCVAHVMSYFQAMTPLMLWLDERVTGA